MLLLHFAQVFLMCIADLADGLDDVWRTPQTSPILRQSRRADQPTSLTRPRRPSLSLEAVLTGQSCGREWTVERKAEEAGVFSYHRGRDDIEDVVVRFLGHLVAMLLEHFPEVALPGIGRHASQHVDDPLLAPVVGRHDQQPGRLRVGGVDILDVRVAAFVAFCQLCRSSAGSGFRTLTSGPIVRPYRAPVSGMNCHMPLAIPIDVGGPLVNGSKSLSCMARYTN